MRPTTKEKFRHEYKDHIVVFVDILGFKEIIKKSETNPDYFKLIYDGLRFLKRRENAAKWNLQLINIEEDAEKRGVDNFDIENITTCSCFSDSIAVSVRCNERNINEITSTLIANLAYIGAFLMTKGILLRGGITIGKLVHFENGIIMGQGLIDAYYLETNSAKFPRIVLSNELLQQLNYPLSTKKDRYPYHQYINRFEDGCVGFHQMIYFQVLESDSNLDEQKFQRQLNRIRNTIIQGLDETFENADIYLKYSWLKKEYDRLIIRNVVKKKIYNLNEGISGNNIHFSHTNSFYDNRNNK